MPLYYIREDVGETGDNQDLFVRAETPEEAQFLWRVYYERKTGAHGRLACPQEVNAIPDLPERGVISWDAIKTVRWTGKRPPRAISSRRNQKEPRA